MGHAVHFLQRLERLSTPLVDLALTMYRDPELVRFVLSRARLPDGAERVALALEDRPDGPHIVVARDGGFVTCLGEGMSVRDLPVVTRSQLDLLGERMDSLRLANAQVSDSREARGRLFAKLGKCGSALSREDFNELSVLLPLVASTCVLVTAELTRDLITFRSAYTRSRYRRLNDKARAELRRYWELNWMASHLAALYGSRAHELPDLIAPDQHEAYRQLTYAISVVSLQSMTTPLMLRGVWTAARAGRVHLAKHKEALQNARCLLDVLLSALPLMGIALRHRGARAEVQKLLERSGRKLDEPQPGWSRWDRKDALLFLGTCKHFLETPDQMQVIHREVGQGLVFDMMAPLPAAHPLRFERPEDVPDELAFVFPTLDEPDLYGSAPARLLLASYLPWAARADITDLYLPARVIEDFREVLQWNPALVQEQLEGQHRYFLRSVPVRRSTPKPGRNQPCSCGSGKKHKRCCGA